MTTQMPNNEAEWDDNADTPTCYWRPGRALTLCGQPYGEAFQLSWNPDEVDCPACRAVIAEEEIDA